jgi:hypothetical protein
MLNSFKKGIRKYGFMILPIGTLLCLAGFIGSYLFPNEVLDTYEVNVKETETDTEFIQMLTGAEDEIGYVMETDGRCLKGIQIGISKNGASLDGTELIYRVYRLPDDEQDDLTERSLITEKSYDLGSCLDGQYPYLPFGDEVDCTGRLYITFTYHANGNTEGTMPGVFANHSTVDNAATYINGEIICDTVDGQEIPRMIKNYYIYSHNTYPLLYDCRVLTFVFLAASMTVCYPKIKHKTVQSKKEGKTDAV